MHLHKRADARARTHTHTHTHIHTRIAVIVLESHTAEKDRGEANWIKISVVFLSYSPKYWVREISWVCNAWLW